MTALEMCVRLMGPTAGAEFSELMGAELMSFYCINKYLWGNFSDLNYNQETVVKQLIGLFHATNLGSAYVS